MSGLLRFSLKSYRAMSAMACVFVLFLWGSSHHFGPVHYVFGSVHFAAANGRVPATDDALILCSAVYFDAKGNVSPWVTRFRTYTIMQPIVHDVDGGFAGFRWTYFELLGPTTEWAAVLPFGPLLLMLIASGAASHLAVTPSAEPPAAAPDSN